MRQFPSDKASANERKYPYVIELAVASANSSGPAGGDPAPGRLREITPESGHWNSVA
jgi:hypothetical protein